MTALRVTKEVVRIIVIATLIAVTIIVLAPIVFWWGIWKGICTR
jgi:hypothetical protein